MPKVSQEKGKVSTPSFSTLVLDPTGRSPAISFYVSTFGKKAKKVWSATVPVIGPGRVSYWPILLRKKKSLPPDRILVVTGPGPFTATRAAVNIANAFGYAWGRSVRGVSLKVLEKQGLQKTLTGTWPTHFEIKDRALPLYIGKAY